MDAAILFLLFIFVGVMREFGLNQISVYQAALIKEDLDKAVEKGGPNMEPRREKFDIRCGVVTSLNRDRGDTHA